ncbi:hypothetical protein DFH09DRAFT_1094607 [Mycena vulgaris]|nr:hypothetical protein DFH09DRAFT_1094607 [Mycena vulgaris]
MGLETSACKGESEGMEGYIGARRIRLAAWIDRDSDKNAEDEAGTDIEMGGGGIRAGGRARESEPEDENGGGESRVVHSARGAQRAGAERGGTAWNADGGGARRGSAWMAAKTPRAESFRDETDARLRGVRISTPVQNAQGRTVHADAEAGGGALRGGGAWGCSAACKQLRQREHTDRHTRPGYNYWVAVIAQEVLVFAWARMGDRGLRPAFINAQSEVAPPDGGHRARQARRPKLLDKEGRNAWQGRVWMVDLALESGAASISPGEATASSVPRVDNSKYPGLMDSSYTPPSCTNGSHIQGRRYEAQKRV